jgi:HK97 family phage portal protein
MILKTKFSGNQEVREFGTQHFVPPPWAGSLSVSGVSVTTDEAVGLPTIGRAIRLVGGLVGSACIGVFSGRRAEKREHADSEQALLLENPFPGLSAFDWRYDVAVSLEASENAFIRKIKTNRGKLVALEVLPPGYVDGRVENGEKVFYLLTSRGQVKLSASEVLHIRGHTVDGGAFGVSRITQHRDPLGSMLAAQRFEGSYFRNSARPDFVMEFPQGISVEQGRAWKAEWDAQMAGADKAGQSRAVGGGAVVKPIPVSMRDAQFIEARGLSIADAARIMDVEEILLGGGLVEQQDDQAMDRFLAFQLPPRLSRITAALKADPDLFPSTTEMYPEFASDPLMFASPQTRAEVEHKEIQAGTLLPDEVRAARGRPPLPDGVGQIPQVTPVGGAPNPSPLPAEE